MSITKYNERSWGIDLISEINTILATKDILIKKAGGENGLKVGSKTLFPDVLLFADYSSGKILQGWELKMPDTAIEDDEFIDNAKKKAIAIGVNSFFLWNVSVAKLYKINEDETLKVLKTWDNLSYIKTR